MEYYVGLDVSLKQTSICVVDQAGLVVREGVVDSDPEAIAAIVRSQAPVWRLSVSRAEDGNLAMDRIRTKIRPACGSFTAPSWRKGPNAT